MHRESADQRSKWRWTLASGLFTILLAVAAFLLPEIEWMPRGGLVGWTLFLAGAAELAFGTKRGVNTVGRAAVGSGLITALAGLLFIINPGAGYFSVANVVMAWLLLRGAWMVVAGLRARSDSLGPWMFFSGAADVLLGIALLAGLQAAALTILLFGQTEQLVAQFALILALSFALSGTAYLAVAIIERRQCNERSDTDA